MQGTCFRRSLRYTLFPEEIDIVLVGCETKPNKLIESLSKDEIYFNYDK